MICFLFISLLAAASALPYNGTCPNVALVKNFHATLYTGKWYEHFVTPATVTGYACAQYEVILEDDTIRLNSSYVSNGHLIRDERILRPIEANSKGKQRRHDLADALLAAKYLVATDYTSYAIEYQCYYDNRTDTHSYQSFVGVRNLRVHEEVKTKINNFFKNNIPDLDLSTFTQIDFSEEACTGSETTMFTPL